MKQLASLFAIHFCLIFAIHVVSAQSQQQLNIRMLQAAKNNQADSVKYWLDKGADINCADSLGLCALHYAIANFNQKLCVSLIENKANDNGTDISLHTVE